MSGTGTAAVSRAYRLVRRDTGTLRPPELDDAQRAVVEHRGGPLLVLAGPGTGKTTTLVETVVDRVERDGMDPSQVLVLTFGRRAAAELRDRISARLGRTIREPVARTFHSYAFGLLRREAVLRGDPAPRLLSGPEQDLMIRELLRGDIEEFGATGWPARLRDALPTRGFAEELRDLLLRAAERGIGPDELEAFGRKAGGGGAWQGRTEVGGHSRDDWIAAARFAREYSAVTALQPEAPAYDPAELVRAAVDLFTHEPDVLAAERAERAVVLVDEYQDADPAQEALLGLLAGGGKDLVVVGDPDQSIYGFRGSEVEVVREFPQRFRTVEGDEAPMVALRTGRRFGRRLLAASRRVTARLGGPPAHRRLVPARGTPEGDVEVHLFRTRAQEAAYLAHRLRTAHLVDGVPWSRMAVLVRAASALAVLRRTLASAGVPVAVRLEEVPLVEQPAVRPLLDMLELATGRAPMSPERAIELLTSCYGRADPLALRRLRKGLRAVELSGGGSRTSDVLIRAALAEPAMLDDLTGGGESGESGEPGGPGESGEPEPEHRRGARFDGAAAAPARRIAAILAAAREAVAAEGSTAETVLWEMWRTTGCAESWARAATEGAGSSVAAAADRDLDAVTALFDAAARFVDRMPAAGAGVFVDHLAGQEIPADTLAPRAPEGDAVTLLTAHAAKGLEWDVVGVAGVQDGVWPDLRVRGTLLGSETLVDLAAGRDTSPVMVLERLLAEERRLFYVAVTRARRLLLVSAVSAEEDQPSRFLDELMPYEGDERPFTRVPRGLDISSMVAHLRSVVTDPAVPEVRRAGAAHHLARLGSAGVRAADPAYWYALPALSDEAPLRAPDEPVRVSPSKVEAYRTCPLRWMLESSGGTRGDAMSQSIGTFVHALAYDVARGAVPLDGLLEAFEERWPTAVDAGTGWHARAQHDRARDMVVRLSDWLRSNARELVAAERAFAVEVERARLAGRVDRLERDSSGRLVVVDLKTGKSKPSKEDLAAHPQLGAYQVAVERGGFSDAAGPAEAPAAADPAAQSDPADPDAGPNAETNAGPSAESDAVPGAVSGSEPNAGPNAGAGSDRTSGGALLVQLGSPSRDPEQHQPPLAESDDPGWAARMVAETAEGMAGSSFAAIENPWCRVCLARRVCPVHVDGGQVTP